MSGIKEINSTSNNHFFFIHCYKIYNPIILYIDKLVYIFNPIITRWWNIFNFKSLYQIRGGKLKYNHLYIWNITLYSIRRCICLNCINLSLNRDKHASLRMICFQIWTIPPIFIHTIHTNFTSKITSLEIICWCLWKNRICA